MKFETIQTMFFFGFLTISTILFFWLIGGFAFTIFWAIFFTIVFYPVYERLLKKTKSKKWLSSIITLLLILVIMVIPISFVSYIFIEEIPKVNETILNTENINDFFDSLPYKTEVDAMLTKHNIDPTNIQSSLVNPLKDSLNAIGGGILSIGKNALNLAINFLIMIYLIYFGLKDGKRYLQRLSKILPLGDKTERRLFKKFSSIVRSIFKGTLIVSIVQGILGGILFYIAGIQGVLVWTVLMIISAMIPAVGIGLVLFPAAIFMMATGNIGAAIFLIMGTAVIGTIDNILRPYLIGHETEIPDMLITLSILGGLLLFGMTGLVIGPVIAGFFLTMWHLFEEKYNDRLDNNE